MITCFTDGSSSLKKKQGGSGILIQEDGKDKLEYSLSFEGIKTGQAEFVAFIACLLLLLEEGKESEQIILYSDSQYVVKEMNEWSYTHVIQRFSGKANSELIYYAIYLKMQFSNLKIIWCKGHQKDNEEDNIVKGNNRADELATKHQKLQKEELCSFSEYLQDIKREIEEENICDYVNQNYKISC